MLELNIWQLSAVVAAAAAFALLCQCVNEDAKSYDNSQTAFLILQHVTCVISWSWNQSGNKERQPLTEVKAGSGGTSSGMTSAECHPVTASPQSAPSCLFNWQMRIKKYTCCYATCPVLQKKKVRCWKLAFGIFFLSFFLQWEIWRGEK